MLKKVENSENSFEAFEAYALGLELRWLRSAWRAVNCDLRIVNPQIADYVHN